MKPLNEVRIDAGFEEIVFPFSNDKVFPIVMQDPERCRELLERILPDKRISEIRLHDDNTKYFPITPEKVINTTVMGHGIRLDVLFEGEDAWYDIEMQVEVDKDLVKRSRYYHSLMDSAYLKKGRKYGELNPHYVIFICVYDPFGLGAPVYFFRMVAEKLNLPLGDETYTIVLNTKAIGEDVSEGLRSLFDYVNRTAINVNDELIRNIHSKVLEINRNEEWRDALMTHEEYVEQKYEKGLAEGRAQGLAEGKAEGLAEGLAEGKKEIIDALLSRGLITPEQAEEL